MFRCQVFGFFLFWRFVSSPKYLQWTKNDQSGNNGHLRVPPQMAQEVRPYEKRVINHHDPMIPMMKKGLCTPPGLLFSGTLHEHLWTASWWLNQPIWKICVKTGSFPQGWKLKNIWNHHLAGESCTYPPSTMKHIAFQTFRPPTFRKQLPNLNLRDSSASCKRCQREQQL